MTPIRKTPAFRKLKARKAKHGFQAAVCLDNFVILAEAKVFVETHDPKAQVALNFNMSSRDMMIYTDNDEVAAAFEAKYVVE